ncbi:MAG: hypothetical protein K0Q75_2679 [Anaerospora sp.]|jgi:hypothetical protein|nr:hypothetical protein [Anaerospora sp.]
MRALLVTLALLAAPSVAFAHTGSVFKTAISFVPMLVILVSILFNRFTELIKKIFYWKKRNE